MYRVTIGTDPMYESEVVDMIKTLGFTVTEIYRPSEDTKLECFQTTYIKFCIEPSNISYARFDNYSCHLIITGAHKSQFFSFEPCTPKIKEVIIDDINMQSFLRQRR